MNNIILLSEFQPLHTLHEEEIIRAKQSDIKDIIFCIDGAYRKLHADSPFSTKEREDMIHILMKNHNMPYSINHLRDSDNDEDRIANIIHLLSPLSGKTIVSDDTKTQKLLEKNNIDSQLMIDHNFSQSTIRNQFAAGNTQEAQKKLPASIFDYLQSLNTAERMKHHKINAFRGPNVAVDMIVRNTKGEIAIIERAHEPICEALPGGMIDRGEYAYNSATREAREETGANGIIQQSSPQEALKKSITNLAQKYNVNISPESQPFIVQTSPSRDPRGHIMTLGYLLNYNGDLGAFSDAKSVSWVKPEDALQNPRIPKDHKEIIISYLAQF